MSAKANLIRLRLAKYGDPLRVDLFQARPVGMPYSERDSEQLLTPRKAKELIGQLESQLSEIEYDPQS